MYLTDHGDYVVSHGLWAKGLPCFKEAYKNCAFVSGPKFEKDIRCDKLTSITDFAPTILDIAQIDTDVKMQGESLVPLLEGKNPDSWREELFTQTNGNELYGIQRSVFNKKWKYVLNTFDYDELYDLKNDSEEMHNIINDDHDDVIKMMCKEMWRFARESGDSCTCPYIMVAVAPNGPGILWDDDDWNPNIRRPGEKC